MNTMYNCTAHDQTQYTQDFANAGFAIEVSPRIGRVEAAFEAMVAEGERAAAGIPDNANVLVGGAQIIIDAASVKLLQRGCRLWAVQTERKSDNNGSFVYNFAGLSETPMSMFWRTMISSLHGIAETGLYWMGVHGVYESHDRVNFENAVVENFNMISMGDIYNLGRIAQEVWENAEFGGVPAIYDPEKRSSAMLLLQDLGFKPNVK